MGYTAVARTADGSRRDGLGSKNLWIGSGIDRDPTCRVMDGH